MSAHYRNVKRRGCFFFLACWIERRELVIIDVRSHVIGVGSWHKRTPGLVCGEHKNAVLVRPIEFCLVTCLYDVDINPPPHHFFLRLCSTGNHSRETVFSYLLLHEFSVCY